MGNTVVWKPASGRGVAGLLHHEDSRMEAGLPPGVINMVPGPGPIIGPSPPWPTTRAWEESTSPAARRSSRRSTWRSAPTSASTSAYPRIVGETGGKDFIFAHASSRSPGALATALVRGAFEYQGQKCSAASRAYIPDSIWNDGSRTACWLDVDPGTQDGRRLRLHQNFMGAVIDKQLVCERQAGYIDLRQQQPRHGDPLRRRVRRFDRLLRRADRGGDAKTPRRS